MSNILTTLFAHVPDEQQARANQAKSLVCKKGWALWGYGRMPVRAARQLSLVALVALGMLNAASAFATTYTVTDTTDNSGDTGSIRYAVNQVNAGSGGDTIDFGAGVNGGTITLLSSLTFSKNVTINGPGANLLTISGGGSYQVFVINTSVVANLSGLTISNGSTSGAGGGINTYGTVTMINCTVSGNSATGSGAGIANYSTLTVENSTISGNTNTGGGNGGGIYNAGALTMTNSTVSGNSAGNGAGIYGSSGSLTLGNSTISSNTASSAGGGIYISSGSLALTNSIVAGNTSTGTAGDDCHSCGTQSPSNLINITTTSPAITTDLGPLQYNGGTTETMMPLPSSPALNAGLSSTYGTDQRGFPRPTGANVASDLGAVQVGPLVVTTTADSTDASAVCDGSDTCSLRDALTLANSQGSADISFATGVTGSITLSSALPAVAAQMTLTGPEQEH